MNIKCERLPSSERNILVLVKAEESFVFVFRDNQQEATLRTLGLFASNPDLNFSWYDAAVLSQRVRKMIANGDRQ